MWRGTKIPFNYREMGNRQWEQILTFYSSGATGMRPGLRSVEGHSTEVTQPPYWPTSATPELLICVHGHDLRAHSEPTRLENGKRCEPVNKIQVLMPSFPNFSFLLIFSGLKVASEAEVRCTSRARLEFVICRANRRKCLPVAQVGCRSVFWKERSRLFTVAPRRHILISSEGLKSAVFIFSSLWPCTQGR